MKGVLDPIKAESLKEVFVSRFEGLILSGKISIGEKLPSERELALQLGVSRPVVHEGLVELAARGLVSMKPRVGSVVSDYRKQGSLAMLESILNYNQGRLEKRLMDSMLQMRILLEVENARLAARKRTKENLAFFDAILDEEKNADPADIENVTDIDYRFHHLIALSTGNMLYPLVLNSFKNVYTNFSGQFFLDPALVPVVFDFHAEFVTAIKNKDEKKAVAIMRRILTHGEEHLKKITGGNI